MIYFPDKILHRYTYQESNTTGAYYEDMHEYVYADDILVDFQNENNQEFRHLYGVDKQNLYKIYLDLDTPLNYSDQLHDDAGNIYTIIGDVQEYSHLHSYKKAHLILSSRGDRQHNDQVEVTDPVYLPSLNEDYNQEETRLMTSTNSAFNTTGLQMQLTDTLLIPCYVREVLEYDEFKDKIISKDTLYKGLTNVDYGIIELYEDNLRINTTPVMRLTTAIKYKPTRRGTHELIIRYAGTTDYAPSQSRCNHNDGAGVTIQVI